MCKNFLIHIDNLQIYDTTVSAEIAEGELNAVIGPNKSGKTTLAKIFCGEIRDFKGTINNAIDTNQISYSAYAADNFRFHYSDFYYQQRYNAFDVANVDTVAQFLQYHESDSYIHELFNAVLSQDILKKKIIELSSGETRKVLLLKNLFKEARIYILDNPFTGLDTASIFIFIDLFKRITNKYGKTIILLLNNNQLGIKFSQTIDLGNKLLNQSFNDSHSTSQSTFFTTPETDFNIVFQIESTTLKAGEKILINDLNWVIRKGEKWLLKGANGAGKTTLMSLLNADNPIAYKHCIKLFDRSRGTGESIWDIKSRIGFISSEIQLYCDQANTVKSIILSGFSDTMVLNRKINDIEKENYHSIIEILGLTNIEDTIFGRLSSGEKKMVMIARAFVKNPPVLILDEPFQGLDNLRFQFLYNFFAQCADENRTIIQIAHLKHEILPCIDHIALIENTAFYLVK